METYDTQAVFSSIDLQGRYAYGNQPRIAQWNLMHLVKSVSSLMTKTEMSRANDIIDAFPSCYESHWLGIVRNKLGLTTSEPGDLTLAREWVALLETFKVDHTLAWRRLADAAEGHEQSLVALFSDPTELYHWLARWRGRSRREPMSVFTQAEAMRCANPLYIPRNHRVEEVLATATNHADLQPFAQLLDVVTHPFEDRAEWASYADPASVEATACYKTFCGT